MDQVIAEWTHAGLGPIKGCHGNHVLETENFGEVFVKVGTGGSDAPRKLLDYEVAGLQHLASCSAKEHLKIPTPLLVGETQAHSGFICLEYLNLKGPRNERALGKALAEMHLTKPTLYDRFGFPMDGCCGAMEQPNNSEGRKLTWVEFYKEYRLGFQLRKAREQFGQDRELEEKGAHLMSILPELFSGLIVEDIEPSILHGDLWAGNVGYTPDGPCIFDPAAFYGHAEMDLGITRMFGGFGPAFYEAYHSLMPKQPGFEKRALLYEVHHHLNHLNIFGESYRGGCLRLLNAILSDTK